MKNIIFGILGIILFFILISIVMVFVFGGGDFRGMFISHLNVIGLLNLFAIVDMLIIVVGGYIFGSFIGNKIFK